MDNLVDLLRRADVPASRGVALESGDSPDMVLAGLALIAGTDGYREADARRALRRVFRLAARASGEAGLSRDLGKAGAVIFFADVLGYDEVEAADLVEGLIRQFGTPARWDWPCVPDGGERGVASSALALFGYAVGKRNGWPRETREAFLADFVEADLPPVVAERFGERYGTPGSAERVAAVTGHLDAMIAARRRQDPRKYKYAIADWQSDLAFLKRRYAGEGEAGWSWV